MNMEGRGENEKQEARTGEKIPRGGYARREDTKSKNYEKILTEGMENK